MSRILLFAQLIVITLVAILHLVGFEYYLYWRFLWFDLIVHTLGGIWASLFLLWMRGFWNDTPNLLWGIFGAIMVGIAWEVFEVSAGLPIASNYVFDTSLDLLMDVLGGVIGSFLFCALGVAVFLWKRCYNPMR